MQPLEEGSGGTGETQICLEDRGVVEQGFSQGTCCCFAFKIKTGGK